MVTRLGDNMTNPDKVIAAILDAPPGIEEGDTCNRDGCLGKMGYEPVRDCSCHISPPCHKCVDNPLVCLECGEEA
jgi:hypothetical protein